MSKSLYVIALVLVVGASVVFAAPAAPPAKAPAASGTAVTTSAAPADAALQKELEGVLSDYKAACKAGDVAKFRACVSSHLYSTLANNLASAGRELDAAVLAQMLQGEAITAEFKVAAVLHDGATAGLLYSRPLQASAGQKPEINVLLRRFVRENDAWKIDANAMTSVPATKPDGTPGAAADATWESEKAVNGKVLPAEPLLPKAEVAGILNTSVRGYAITITINGVPQVTDYENSNGSQLIRGGLKKGANTIKVTVRPSAQPVSSKSLRIGINAQLLGQTGSSTVYTLEPAGEPQAAYEATFNVQAPAPTATAK